MSTLFVAYSIPILSGLMALISFKYDFKSSSGKITTAGYFFYFLVLFSIASGVYIAWDTYDSANKNNKIQLDLRNSVSNVSAKLTTVLKGIDSLGYKQDKNGKLVSKRIPVTNSATVKRGNPIIQQNKNGSNQANSNTGTNSGNIGNNGHVVHGNNYGVNGDVYVSENHLTESGKKFIKKQIDSVKTRMKSKDNCVEVDLLTTGNGAKVADEILAYVKELGYVTGGVSALASDINFKGIEVSFVDGCYLVSVGIF